MSEETGQVAAPSVDTDNAPVEASAAPTTTETPTAPQGETATPNTSTAPVAQATGSDEPTGSGGKYDAGDNKALGQVYDTFSTLGLTPPMAQLAFAKADVTGNPADIDYGMISDKLGQQTADAIKAVSEGYHNQEVARGEAIRTVCDKVAGGKEQWDSVKGWAEQAVSQGGEQADSIKQYAEMFGQSDAMTEFAATKLNEMFSQSAGTTKAATLVKGESTTTPAKAGLTKGEFSKQYLKAKRAGDNTEINRLVSARAVARKQGI